MSTLSTSTLYWKPATPPGNRIPPILKRILGKRWLTDKRVVIHKSEENLRYLDGIMDSYELQSEVWMAANELRKDLINHGSVEIWEEMP